MSYVIWEPWNRYTDLYLLFIFIRDFSELKQKSPSTYDFNSSHLFMAKVFLVDVKKNEVTHSDEGIAGTDSTDGMD